MVEFPNLIPALPEIFLVCAGMALLMVGVFRGESSTRLVSGLAVVALLVTAALVVGSDDQRVVTFEGQFVVDRFGAFMKILVLIGAALSIIASLDYLENEQLHRFEYSVLVVFATVGMLMMVSANDLLALYVGLETQSLALYVLASFRRDHARSSEAGLKYFVLGALSSGLLLYGSSLVYGFAGTTGFDGLSTLFENGAPQSLGLVIGLVFVTAGIAFKISAVPFHMWTPDVYEGAPTPVTAFFAVAPKIAAVALFLRVLLDPFGNLIGQWQQIVYFVAVASMLLGSFAAIGQVNIKRLMAYSSIGNIGYALVGLAAANESGIRGVLMYMAVYLFMTLGAFGVILCMRQNGRAVEGIDDLRGLSRTHPLLALSMAVFMFSMAGIPPLAGFFSKLYVFLAAVEAQMYVLAVIGVVTSVVSAFYYLRIVKLMYFDEPAEAFDRPIGMGMTAVLAGTGLFTLLFFAFQGPILSGALAAAASLIGR
ncbi:MAG TPA: NADH-quinone oxidoreductase subunit NuoN [Azospirillaceae bacterium]|nr:NADH-quinone oxidoreductase subunit NuoN [Azospirillaceae bacterium]